MRMVYQIPDVESLADRMIRRIWQQKHLCGFTDEEVLTVIYTAKRVMTPEPACLPVVAPVIVFGDVHGQLNDLLKFLTLIGPPPQNRLLFLGDYVDRCKKSFEVMMLLFCYKIKYPTTIHLLRGNHECAKMNRIYGFHEELKRKRNEFIWKEFNVAFNELPLCASINRSILCMHGGISEQIKSWDDLNNLKKPKSPKECDEGIAVDLMWSDPNTDPCCPGYQFNQNRATSVWFGEESVKSICELLDISFIVRAHEVVKDGHSWAFNQRLVTLFSAPNYCGSDGNCGSVMKVSSHLEIQFLRLRPTSDRQQMTAAQQKLLEKMSANPEAHSPDPNQPKPRPTTPAPEELSKKIAEALAVAPSNPAALPSSASIYSVIGPDSPSPGSLSPKGSAKAKATGTDATSADSGQGGELKLCPTQRAHIVPVDSRRPRNMPSAMPKEKQDSPKKP